MDHKTWLWRKKSSEKTIVISDKVRLSVKGNEEETLVTDKKNELDRSVKNLNEKLSSALSECNAKDDLVMSHANVAEEAIQGWEKAEAEAVFLKQELVEALQQRVAAEERIAHLDAALKECMQHLRFVREDQEQRIHDAVTKTSRQLENAWIVSEEKLADARKWLAKLGVENSHLSKALQAKEKLIDDLSECNSQAEADFNALMARLDSTKRVNASLSYEVCMLEKELEIRNKEREFNLRSDDVSHKLHLENVKKIAKLETECQRLRLLVRKRLPGPASLAKMKNEVELFGREPSEMRRKLNPPMTGLMLRDFAPDNSHDSPCKRINHLIEQLRVKEEENNTLKESLTKKNNELKSSRITCARTAFKLSQAEAQLGELSKVQTIMEREMSIPVSNDLSLASISEGGGNEDELSLADSWASALISELENFRNGKPKGPISCKTVGLSDICLMDDFVEMEKLAIVSMDKSFESSHVSSDECNTFVGPLETEFGVCPSEANSKDLVQVLNSQSGFSDTNQYIQSKDILIGKYPSWLQDILRLVLEQNRVTQKTPDEILEEIRIALACMNHVGFNEVMDASENSRRYSMSDPPHSGYISWRPPNTSPMVDSFDQASGIISLKERSSQQLRTNLSKSICKIIELLEGINQPSLMDYNTQLSLPENDGSSLPYNNSTAPTGYINRVFQWKSSELSVVVQQFVHTCNDLLNGNADLENFARELTSALDWIMNHCFSLQDVSSMRDTIKRHFDWDESESESELEVGMNSPRLEAEKVQASEEQSPCLSSSAASNGQINFSQMDELQLNSKEEYRRLEDKLTNVESAKNDLEGKLQSATDKIEALMIQLRESEESIVNSQTEQETWKESKGLIEDQIENHKLLNEDLNTQLTIARVELNEAFQKFSSLEVELEDKSNCCQELEATCLDLQLQSESVPKKEVPKYDTSQEERQLRTDWGITAASEKLAECQETILNLGKQLKALAPPTETALFDKVISTTPATKKKKTNRHSSLLDQMLAEDDPKAEDLKSPKTKEIICTVDSQKLPTRLSDVTDVKSPERFLSSNETKYRADTGAGGDLPIVPSKRPGGGVGLLRKLLLRRERESGKKMSQVPTHGCINTVQ